MFDFFGKRSEYPELPQDKDRQTTRGKHKPRFMWTTDDPEYVKERLGRYINFFDTQRDDTRRREVILQYFIIGFGALIPIINIFGIEKFYSNIASAILGGGIAAITAVLQFQKYHERWLSFKQAGTKLSNEYYRWKNCTGEYALKDSQTLEEMEQTVTKQVKLLIAKQTDQQDIQQIEQRIRDDVLKKFKLALLVERCEEIITSEAFDYVALFSSTNSTDLRGQAIDH
jgi:hypothetical protein